MKSDRGVRECWGLAAGLGTTYLAGFVFGAFGPHQSDVVYACMFLAVGGAVGAATQRVFSWALIGLTATHAPLAFALLYIADAFAGARPKPATHAQAILICCALVFVGAALTHRIRSEKLGVGLSIALLVLAPFFGWVYKLFTEV